MDKKFEDWNRLWDQWDIERLLRNLARLKTIALAEKPAYIDVALLDATLARLSAKAGKGRDVIGAAADITSLPDAGKTEFINPLNKIIQVLGWPWQLLLSIVALLQ